MEGIRMRKFLFLIAGLALSTGSLSAQGKPVIVVQPFTAAPGVELPYDLKQMQPQLIAEFRVELGKEYEFVAEPPASPGGTVYTLSAEITGWRPGNVAKRLVVGLGSGREASDLDYRVTDSSGKKVLEKKDTVRTNFYAQGTGSTGTLAHPIAQKIADRIKEAKLK
jgi:hypothetical protein